MKNSVCPGLNAQLKAGAAAICYFDPLASPAIIERAKYLETGHKIAKKTLNQIKGATATHLASGIAFPVVDDVAATGSAVLGCRMFIGRTLTIG